MIKFTIIDLWNFFKVRMNHTGTNKKHRPLNKIEKVKEMFTNNLKMSQTNRTLSQQSVPSIGITLLKLQKINVELHNKIFPVFNVV